MEETQKESSDRQISYFIQTNGKLDQFVLDFLMKNLQK